MQAETFLEDNTLSPKLADRIPRVPPIVATKHVYKNSFPCGYMTYNLTITGVIFGMEAILERCVGLDLHQETLVSFVPYGNLDYKPKQEIRDFSATTRDCSYSMIGLH